MCNFENNIYVPNKECEVTELGDGYLMLYNPTTTLTFVLDQITTSLWTRCTGTKNVSQIINDLIANIDTNETSPSQIYDDCIEVFEMMISQEVIVLDRQTEVCSK